MLIKIDIIQGRRCKRHDTNFHYHNNGMLSQTTQPFNPFCQQWLRIRELICGRLLHNLAETEKFCYNKTV